MSEYEKKLNEAAEHYQKYHTLKPKYDAFKAGSDFGREYQRGMEDEALSKLLERLHTLGQAMPPNVISMEIQRAVIAYNKSKDLKP